MDGMEVQGPTTSDRLSDSLARPWCLNLSNRSGERVSRSACAAGGRSLRAPVPWLPVVPEAEDFVDAKARQSASVIPSRVNNPLSRLLSLVSLLALASPAPGAVDFGRDVRPLLERHCLECHGPKQQKSGYRLDVREVAIRGGDSGRAAIVPHDAANSPLVR